MGGRENGCEWEWMNEWIIHDSRFSDKQLTRTQQSNATFESKQQKKGQERGTENNSENWKTKKQ